MNADIHDQVRLPIGCAGNCDSGRALCKSPLRCCEFDAVQAIDSFRSLRLAPGVIEGPEDVSGFEQETVNGLLASIGFWVAGAVSVLLWTAFYFFLKGTL